MSEVASEARSSVAVTGNAKGEAQVSAKMYDGVEPDEAHRLAALAVEVYVEARDLLAATGKVVLA